MTEPAGDPQWWTNALASMSDEHRRCLDACLHNHAYEHELAGPKRPTDHVSARISVHVGCALLWRRIFSRQPTKIGPWESVRRAAPRCAALRRAAPRRAALLASRSRSCGLRCGVRMACVALRYDAVCAALRRVACVKAWMRTSGCSLRCVALRSCVLWRVAWRSLHALMPHAVLRRVALRCVRVRIHALYA